MFRVQDFARAARHVLLLHMQHMGAGYLDRQHAVLIDRKNYKMFEYILSSLVSMRRDALRRGQCGFVVFE